MSTNKHPQISIYELGRRIASTFQREIQHWKDQLSAVETRHQTSDQGREQFGGGLESHPSPLKVRRAVSSRYQPKSSVFVGVWLR